MAGDRHLMLKEHLLRLLNIEILKNSTSDQRVICPTKCGRVEYVITCMKQLFIVLNHSVKEYKRNPSNPPGNLVGLGGALVEAITFNRRVVGSTPALAAK